MRFKIVIEGTYEVIESSYDTDDPAEMAEIDKHGFMDDPEMILNVMEDMNITVTRVENS